MSKKGDSKKQSSFKTTEKPEITHSVISTDGDKITKMEIKKIVTTIGTGAHVMVPKSLIGKYVTIIYEVEKQ